MKPTNMIAVIMDFRKVSIVCNGGAMHRRSS